MRYPILALLADGPVHGYELKQAFDDRFGAVWPPINVGQIYNTLSALERGGMVRGEEVPQRGAPRRRVYELTAEGRDALEKWLNAPSPIPTLKEESIVKLIMAHVSGVADPMALVDQQRQEYKSSQGPRTPNMPLAPSKRQVSLAKYERLTDI